MYNIYVLVRPDAELFIKKVAQTFEVVIFTASISKYASPLLDILDKEKNIKYRLYRDQCTFINGIYIKDLKKCNRSLKDLIIVDNSPIAYTFDSDNGLPIKTWIEDPEDKELMKLVPILEFLSKTKDVRKFIDQFVYNNKILYEEAMEIIKMKELIDKKNNLLNVSKNTNYNDNFTHNLKVLPKDNIEDDSSLKEDKITKKEEIKEKHKINNEDTKNNTDNDNTDKDNNNFNNYSNKEIEIKNKIEELKLKLNLISKDSTDSNNTNNTNGAFPDNGFNTTKNSNKLSNNINFIDKDMRENNSNVYNTNNDTNISSNKVGGIKINSQKQNKKNIFRFKAQEQQQPNKIGLNNIIYSNKFDPSLPLTLLLSNISKGILTPKASSQDKNNKDKNKMKKNVDKNINNIKPVLLRDLPSDGTNMNKKTKYINLLEKFKGYNNKINNISIHNHKKMKNNYSMKNMNVAKPYNLRVSSSISSYHGYNIGGANTFKEKNGTTFNRVTKSKSTDNFMLYNNKFPKTPKEQYKQRIVMNNKNIINFFDGINYTKSTKNNNGIYSKQNYGGTHKMKKNKMNKK
jgi:Dullard-like phosphatase family protein